MPHGYCTGCDARVTVVDGRCLLDHDVDPSTVTDRPGRRRSRAGRHRPREALREAAPTPIHPPGPPKGPPQDSTRPPAPRPEPRRATQSTGSLTPTKEHIVRMWEVDEPIMPMTGWLADELDLEEGDPSVPRSAQVALALAMLTGLIGFVLGVARPQADRLMVEVAGQATVLSEAATRTAASAPEMLTTSTAADAPADSLIALDQAARAMFELAARLPTSEPDRAVALGVAQGALELETVLADALSYRLAVTAALPPPRLPDRVGPRDMRTVSEEVTNWVADLAETLTAVPPTPPPVDYQKGAPELAEYLTGWHSRYLSALRAEDAGAAREEALAVRSRLAEYEAQVERRMLDLAQWAESHAQSLASEAGRITPPE